jgi:para-nitrobenzyl esterase
MLLGSLAAGGLLAARGGRAAVIETGEMPGDTVETRQGRVRGVRRGPVTIFRGLRYGAATGGAARFLPPAPPPSWTGVREAARFGDRCPQNPFPAALAGEDDDIGTSEDCLTLNIWTPGADQAARRPVMVWFHGGGFVIGHGGQARFDGSNLAAGNDVVVVTVTHRLGVFGFLCLDELDPRFAGSGNASLSDCIAALEWVRDNIGAFGGDPGNVTVFGQSGGGAKISTLMAMPAAAGLFHKAIVQSGSWLRAIERTAATDGARNILRHLEIDAARVGDLQAVPADRLLAAANATVGPGLTAFGPVVDGRTLPRHPWSPDAPDLFADIPMIVGTTKDETTLFSFLQGGADNPDFSLDEAGLVARLAALMAQPAERVTQLVQLYRVENPGTSPSDIYFRITTDAGLRHAAIWQAERKAAQGRGAAYMYLFAWESPAFGGKLRAAHSADIPFVFDNPGSNPLNGTDAGQEALAALMSRTWATFARTGDPNHSGLPRWAPYDAGTRATMVFKTGPELVNDPGGRSRALYQALLPA